MSDQQTQRQIDELKTSHKELKSETSEIKGIIRGVDVKMSENMSQIAECLNHLIELQERDRTKEAAIEELKESDKLKTQKIAELDKQSALQEQAQKASKEMLKETKEIINIAIWKLIGALVGAPSLIAAIYVAFVK